MSRFDHVADAEGQYLQACSRGDKDEVSSMLDSGRVDLEVSSAGQAWRGLHRASLGGHDEVVNLLLLRGADLEAQAADGRTALHYAAAEGKWMTALILIRHKANLEARDSIGNTPVLCAARRAHVETIVHLILEGASLDAVDNLGRGLLSLFGNITRVSPRERQAAVKAMNEARSFYLRSVAFDSKLVGILGVTGVNNRGERVRGGACSSAPRFAGVENDMDEKEVAARVLGGADGQGLLSDNASSAARRKAALKAKGWTVGSSRWSSSPAPPPPPQICKICGRLPTACTCISSSS